MWGNPVKEPACQSSVALQVAATQFLEIFVVSFLLLVDFFFLG